MAAAPQQRKLPGTHRAVVDSLARELELPVEQVESTYLEEITKLEADARIMTFVSVLAAGSTRVQLRRRQPPGR